MSQDWSLSPAILVCQFCLTQETKGFGKGSGYEDLLKQSLEFPTLELVAQPLISSASHHHHIHKPSMELKHSGIALPLTS